MARLRNPDGLVRFQCILPAPIRSWVQRCAREQDRASKARGGRAVRDSHLVTRAIEFYMAHTELVEAWERTRHSEDPKEVDEALRFYRRFKRPVTALLGKEADGTPRP